MRAQFSVFTIATLVTSALASHLSTQFSSPTCGSPSDVSGVINTDHIAPFVSVFCKSLPSAPSTVSRSFGAPASQSPVRRRNAPPNGSVKLSLNSDVCEADVTLDFETCMGALGRVLDACDYDQTFTAGGEVDVGCMKFTVAVAKNNVEGAREQPAVAEAPVASTPATPNKIVTVTVRPTKTATVTPVVTVAMAAELRV